MIFYNGKIITMNPGQKVVDYLEVDHDKISRLGIGNIGFEHGINLQGKTLIPGFIDTHLHLLSYGDYLRSLDLSECNSIDELTHKVKRYVKSKAPGHLIIGRGWDENRYGGILPGRTDLDKAAPDNPVILSRVCGHLIVVNSRTLEMLGIQDSFPAPDGGAIDRDDSGRMTGIFREKAIKVIVERLPKRTLGDIKDVLSIAGKSVLAQGITTVHTDDLEGFTELQPFLQLYEQLFTEGMIPKAHIHIKPEHLKEASFLGYKTGTRFKGITIGAVKIFADGSLGARTAAMIEDYTDSPGDKGILCYNDSELYSLVKKAHDADFAVAIHGIGDMATSQIVRILSKVQKDNPKPHLRHCLIHAQILNEEVIEEMVHNDIHAEIQPIFINTDLHWAESRVGKRIKTSYNWRTLWEKGVKLSGSSDCPVESSNPLWGIYSAVTRKDLKGIPENGWYLEEALTLEQALQLYTVCGAYAGSEEDEKGSLEEGKFADLVILDKPIDTIPKDELKDVQVLMTILDGKIVYQK